MMADIPMVEMAGDEEDSKPVPSFPKLRLPHARTPSSDMDEIGNSIIPIISCDNNAEEDAPVSARPMLKLSFIPPQGSPEPSDSESDPEAVDLLEMKYSKKKLSIAMDEEEDEHAPKLDQRKSFEVTAEGIFKTELYELRKTGFKRTTMLTRKLRDVVDADGISTTNLSTVASSRRVDFGQLSSATLEQMGVLGRGASGQVTKCLHVPSTTVVALKSIDVTDKGRRSQFTQEMFELDTLDCPNIVEFFGAYYEEGHVFLALEFMDRGAMDTVVKKLANDGNDFRPVNPNRPVPLKPHQRLSEKVLSNAFRQILMGLDYLHSQNKIHRDIKPGNMLLNCKGECKLSDFGLTSSVEAARGRDSFVGTTIFMSPERITGGEYSLPSDMWSIGMSLIYMCIGHSPVDTADGYFGIVMSIKDDFDPKLDPTFFSASIIDFCTRCLYKDPEKRMTVKQALEHPFIKEGPATIAETMPLWPKMFDMGVEKEQDFSQYIRSWKQKQLSRKASTKLKRAGSRGVILTERVFEGGITESMIAENTREEDDDEEASMIQLYSIESPSEKRRHDRFVRRTKSIRDDLSSKVGEESTKNKLLKINLMYGKQFENDTPTSQNHGSPSRKVGFAMNDDEAAVSTPTNPFNMADVLYPSFGTATMIEPPQHQGQLSNMMQLYDDSGTNTPRSASPPNHPPNDNDSQRASTNNLAMNSPLFPAFPGTPNSNLASAGGESPVLLSRPASPPRTASPAPILGLVRSSSRTKKANPAPPASGEFSNSPLAIRRIRLPSQDFGNLEFTLKDHAGTKSDSSNCNSNSSTPRRHARHSRIVQGNLITFEGSGSQSPMRSATPSNLEPTLERAESSTLVTVVSLASLPRSGSGSGQSPGPDSPNMNPVNASSHSQSHRPLSVMQSMTTHSRGNSPPRRKLGIGERSESPSIELSSTIAPSESFVLSSLPPHLRMQPSREQLIKNPVARLSLQVASNKSPVVTSSQEPSPVVTPSEPLDAMPQPVSLSPTSNSTSSASVVNTLTSPLSVSPQPSADATPASIPSPRGWGDLLSPASSSNPNASASAPVVRLVPTPPMVPPSNNTPTNGRSPRAALAISPSPATATSGPPSEATSPTGVEPNKFTRVTKVKPLEGVSRPAAILAPSFTSITDKADMLVSSPLLAAGRSISNASPIAPAQSPPPHNLDPVTPQKQGLPPRSPFSPFSPGNAPNSAGILSPSIDVVLSRPTSASSARKTSGSVFDENPTHAAPQLQPIVSRSTSRQHSRHTSAMQLSGVSTLAGSTASSSTDSPNPNASGANTPLNPSQNQNKLESQAAALRASFAVATSTALRPVEQGGILPSIGTTPAQTRSPTSKQFSFDTMSATMAKRPSYQTGVMKGSAIRSPKGLSSINNIRSPKSGEKLTSPKASNLRSPKNATTSSATAGHASVTFNQSVGLYASNPRVAANLTLHRKVVSEGGFDAHSGAWGDSKTNTPAPVIVNSRASLRASSSSSASTTPVMSSMNSRVGSAVKAPIIIARNAAGELTPHKRSLPQSGRNSPGATNRTLSISEDAFSMEEYPATATSPLSPISAAEAQKMKSMMSTNFRGNRMSTNLKEGGDTFAGSRASLSFAGKPISVSSSTSNALLAKRNLADEADDSYDLTASMKYRQSKAKIALVNKTKASPIKM